MSPEIVTQQRRLCKLSMMPMISMVNVARSFSKPDLVKGCVDLFLMVIAAAWAWFASFGQLAHPGSPLPFLEIVVAVRLVIYLALQLHKASWLNVSRHEVLMLAISAVMAPFFIYIALHLVSNSVSMGLPTRPYWLLATEAALYMLLLCAARITVRAVESSSRNLARRRRTLIVGAGAAGRSLTFQIHESANEYDIIGFVDDDPRKLGRSIRGHSVLGTTEQLSHLIERHSIEEVIVAIATLPPERLRKIIAACEPSSVPLRILPQLQDLIQGRADVRALREVHMEDLLPRPEVKLDHTRARGYLEGKTVLVTGGGGSIGGELCRQVLRAGAARLLILGRGENSVFEMSQELAEQGSDCKLIPVICDVRDRKGLQRIFHKYQPSVVFHAAAHKHVPLMELYPSEAVRNNVLGTLNVVELAVEQKVDRFVMVSTDKAVNPSSVMGATKRIGEMIVKAYASASGLNLVSVRFGNVLGSRGSVVPTMTRQIRRGLPVTITDPQMVRYFMTIPEASQLILQAGATGGCGEVFVLDMGRPVRILDLAQDLIRLHGLVPDRDIPIRIIGRRPGEKMHEELLTHNESRSAEKKGLFFMAPSQAVDIDALLLQIAKLIESSQEGNDPLVLKTIRSIVPAFSPENGYSEIENHIPSILKENGVQTRQMTNGSKSSA